MDSRGIALVAGGLMALACSLPTAPANSSASGNASAPASGSASSATLIPSGVQGNRSTNITKLYDEYCAKCHGYNAEGGGGGTPSLLIEDKFDQKWDKPFFDVIKNGLPNGGMDAYGKSLSDAEIWGLVVHIRERQKDGLRKMGMGPKKNGSVYSSKYHSYKVETVIPAGSGLQTPWGIDWLPNKSMLITNRPGFVMLADPDGKNLRKIEGIPQSIELGQGGMMEVSVHPQYAKNGWIYLGFTQPRPDGQRGGITKIVRGKLDSSGSTPKWTSQQTIFEIPFTPQNYTGSSVHFGTRIVFDGKGNIFFSIGERGEGNKAQDLNFPNGKIYRVKEDGAIPSDNPFVSRHSGDKKWLGAVWSYGHRNPQGLVIDLQGNLWDTEHGPRGGDECNLIKKGANYGWQKYAHSINYNDTPLSVPWPAPGENIEVAKFRWLPSIGACGLDLGKGGVFPQWKGDLFAGGLSGSNVDRLRFKNGELVEREEIIVGLGRVREVATAPDGAVYVALNQPDSVIRIIPVK